jgi:hypothetical protein
LFGAIYEVCRMPYSVVVLHHPPVCMWPSTNKQCVMFSWNLVQEFFLQNVD